MNPKDGVWANDVWRTYRRRKAGSKLHGLSTDLLELCFMDLHCELPFGSDLKAEFDSFKSVESLTADAEHHLSVAISIISVCSEMDDHDVHIVQWRVSCVLMMHRVAPDLVGPVDGVLGRLNEEFRERKMSGAERRRWAVQHRSRFRTSPPFRLLWAHGDPRPPWPHHLG